MAYGGAGGPTDICWVSVLACTIGPRDHIIAKWSTARVIQLLQQLHARQAALCMCLVTALLHSLGSALIVAGFTHLSCSCTTSIISPQKVREIYVSTVNKRCRGVDVSTANKRRREGG